MGKAFYSWSMQRDVEMPDTVVRFVVVRLLCLFSHFFFIYSFGVTLNIRTSVKTASWVILLTKINKMRETKVVKFHCFAAQHF